MLALESRPMTDAHHPPAGPSAGAPRAWTLADFDFDLPPALIAQTPATERSGSRLLEVGVGQFHDRLFRDLPGLLAPGDLLVFNDSRVIKARLLGRKASGGQLEALVERVLDRHEALAQLKVSKKPAPGSLLHFDAPPGAPAGPGGGAPQMQGARVLGRAGEFFHLRFEAPVLEVLDSHGLLPLPPYISHSADAGDAQRYQTVYARHDGSVAAPTAGLHFEAPLFEALRARGVDTAFVTLHVGAGTFQPVRVDNLDEHRMHSERYRIDEACAQAIRAARARGGRIIAVGTTSLRTLEGAALAQQSRGTVAACEGDTELFVRPGFDFRIVDRLVTNFHLPRSTLLMLVSAFAGYDRLRAAYAHAIAQRYRFFSYGDAMLLTRTTS